VRRIALAAVVLLALGGCVSPAADAGAEDADDRLTVFAAASLAGVFTELGDEFEAGHPGVTVAFEFGGSSGLAAQIVQGAPADVFAAASPETIRIVVDAGLARDPATFATNSLELVVPEGNPGAVTGLADLADPDLAIALCAAEVPCGAASASLLDDAGVAPSVDTLEQDVTAVLTRVRAGEADAGLVYRTDVLAAGDDVEGIEIAGADRATNDYPVVALDGAGDTAGDFVAFVLSDEGLAVMEAAGFGAP
jgi:molybdate transport system substrate-binding protein